MAVVVTETVPIIVTYSLPKIDGPSPPSIPAEELPRCQTNGCGGLLRPHVVWFGEGLESSVLKKAGMFCN